jgi:putative copper export protein
LRCLLSGAFMASAAWAGHRGANAGPAGAIQVVADALHLAAAGTWIGRLLPFALVMACALRTRSEAWNRVAANITRRFSHPERSTSSPDDRHDRRLYEAAMGAAIGGPMSRVV